MKRLQHLLILVNVNIYDLNIFKDQKLYLWMCIITLWMNMNVININKG